MSLISLVDNSRTDKNTVHSYLELYEKLLCSKKETVPRIYMKMYDFHIYLD